MAGILDGLGQFGLGNLENVDLYETTEETEPEEKLSPMQKQLQMEQDFIFDKSYVCPVCDREFKSKTVKVGKAKLVGTDADLRPKYEGIDLLKYDIVLCPKCGYAALSRYFKSITQYQTKRIKEMISKVFKEQKDTSDTYSYEEALERYKLALANTIVKQGKASEKAYICLKTAWLLRGRNENLDTSDPDYAKKKADGEAEEKEFLKHALEGFLAARQNENFPMCGMDEATVDYLIAVMAMEFEQFDVASRLVSGILGGVGTNPRIKDRARDLREALLHKIKESKK